LQNHEFFGLLGSQASRTTENDCRRGWPEWWSKHVDCTRARSFAAYPRGQHNPRPVACRSVAGKKPSECSLRIRRMRPLRWTLFRWVGNSDGRN